LTQTPNPIYTLQDGKRLNSPQKCRHYYDVLKIRLKKINLSPVEALIELDSLYKVYLRDKQKGFKLSRIVALTKQQEKILKTIDKALIAIV